MVDAQEIYRRFCATPLRLRNKPTPPPSSSSSTGSDESSVVAQHPELPPQTPNYRAQTPLKTATKEDVERLNDQIEVECRVEDFVTPKKAYSQTPVRSAAKVGQANVAARTTTAAAIKSNTTKTRPRVAKPEAIPEPIARKEETDAVSRKQKRVTRAVAIVNSNTGGVCVDTPTKALAPPKRSRKTTRQQPQKSPPKPLIVVNSPVRDANDDEKSLAVTLFASSSPESDELDFEMDDTEKENVPVESVPISRNIMDAFAEIDDALPVELLEEKAMTPKKPKAKTTKAPAKPKAKRAPAPKREPAAKKAPKRAPAKPKQPAQPPSQGTRRSRRLQDKEDQAPVPEEEYQLDEEQLEILAALELETEEYIEPEPAKPAAINVEKAFCEPLLETKTTSGALFALWFHALRQEIESAEKDKTMDEYLEILSAFFALCMGISQCEAMVKNHNQPDKDDSDDDATEASVSTGTNLKKKKRSVVFRHFDLSTVDLRYEDEDSAAKFAETLLRHYVNAMHTHTLTLRERLQNPAQTAIIEQIIDVLNDTDRLAEQSTHDGVVATAFRGMSVVEHSEIRASQPYFSAEFAKLKPKAVSAHSFLQKPFASIVSSLVRFRLRELFLPFDPEGLLDEGEQLKIAKYEHQHFGAAIHRALKEIHEYQPLVAPLLAIISRKPAPSEDTIKQAILLIDVEDLVYVEQYILACRYLRLSFSRCILLDGSEDEDTLYFCDRLEYVCALARRLQFEDEAHLFPLANVEEFVKVLEQREPSMAVLEQTLLLVNMPHYATEAPCVECNEIVTRAQQDEAITCSSCSGRFHLSCLHLPASFLQFANQYTCPFCYTGRARR